MRVCLRKAVGKLVECRDIHSRELGQKPDQDPVKLEPTGAVEVKGATYRAPGQFG